MLDRNATLEDDYAKAAAYQPLLDSYKSKVDALESKSTSLQREMDRLQLDLERTREELVQAEEERRKQAEKVALYEERMRELDEGAGKSVGMRRSSTGGGTSLEDGGGGDDLDDALSGVTTTTTDLKLRIHRLERQLAQAQQGGHGTDPQPAVVLQNLLEDANRLKDQVQEEYLAEHREKLVLRARLDEIMSGKSALGDGLVCFGSLPSSRDRASGLTLFSLASVGVLQTGSDTRLATAPERNGQRA